MIEPNDLLARKKSSGVFLVSLFANKPRAKRVIKYIMIKIINVILHPSKYKLKEYRKKVIVKQLKKSNNKPK